VKTLLRSTLALCLVLILVKAIVPISHWIEHRFHLGAPVADQHQALLHAPGSVLSLAATGPDSAPLHLCFTIHSFAEIPIRDRSFYEATEGDRQATEGPLCRDLPRNTATAALHSGDSLVVGYQLESGGRIHIAQLTAHGQDLLP
jgi:hypothetical protein